jgi:GH25 family lysozyme M1 (1,4-beta-N-acetylmuramidase)
MTEILGVDVSKWQGRMDWNKAYDAGIRFAIIRAGSIDNATGVPYTDDLLEQHYAGIVASPIKVWGFYWYFRPNHDAAVQNQYFINLIQHKGATIPPVIDVEEAGGMTPSQIRRAITFMVPNHRMVYTSPGFWNSHVVTNPGTSWQDGGVHLWQAQWTAGALNTINGWRAGGHMIHQFEVSPNGARYGASSKEIDLDRWNSEAYPFPGDTEIYLPVVLSINGKRYEGQVKEI